MLFLQINSLATVLGLVFQLPSTIACAKFRIGLSDSSKHAGLDDGRFFSRFDDQLHIQNVLHEKLLCSKARDNNLVRRTLTTEQVNEKVQELHKEMKITKAEAGSHPFFRPKEITDKNSQPKYTDLLMAQLELDLGNKDGHLARKRRREQEINKEVMKLEVAGRTEDAARLENAVNEWGTVFDTFLESMEHFYEARKGARKKTQKRKTNKVGPKSAKDRRKHVVSKEPSHDLPLVGTRPKAKQARISKTGKSV
ncbi:hypothetical protein MMC10_008863 [Thelotrema lepadinum]|nr:hypothetical protein [Thelotrema lepadinum]